MRTVASGRRRSPVPDWWQRGTAIGGLFSVVLVGVGLYLTNDFNRDQLALQRRSTEQHQRLVLQGQRADRLVRAVDQLGQNGDDRLSVRLGGIYALEALMRDSATDENTVIEVLCAFVRDNLPREDDAPPEEATADVRAAVTVLARRPDPRGHFALDFSDTAGLAGISLAETDLVRADLRRADLRGADLRGTDLHRADLRGTDLRGAIVDAAQLACATTGEAGSSAGGTGQAGEAGRASGAGIRAGAGCATSPPPRAPR
jgi:Pentapeptide repeats (8 copies)